MNCTRLGSQCILQGVMMKVSKLIGLSVGADLSRTSPIYRPSVHVPVSELFCYKSSLRPYILPFLLLALLCARPDTPHAENTSYVVGGVDLAAPDLFVGVYSTALDKPKAACEGRSMPSTISITLARATGRNATAGRWKRSQS